MAFTKVAPAGIGSTPGDGYRIGDSFLHSTGVEITNINATGIVTAASLDISGGIDFDGHTELDNVNISGVSTFAGNIDANGDLDVDGHTNLDNVNIAGITTINGGKLAIGNVVPSKMLELYSGSTVASMHESAGASYVEAQFKNSARHYILGLRPDQSSAFCILDNTSGSGGVLLKASGHTVTLDHDLDVDGHTDLDNVSIAGVTTVSNKTQVNSLGVGIVPDDHMHLHISSANPRILIKSTGTNASKIFFGDSSSNDPGVIEYAHSENSMRFNTGNLERLRITGAGDLSLRTTTQNAYLGLTANSTAINTTLGSTAGTNPRMYLKGVGNGQSDAGDVFIGAGTGGIVHIRSAEYIKFDVNSDSSNTEALRINSSGQVSLGNNPTVASDAALHIELDGAREYLRLDADSAGNNAYIEIEAPNNRRKALIFKSGGTRRGVIGIGDSDEAANATSLFFSASSNIGGNSPHMVITSDGQIGVNNSSPDAWHPSYRSIQIHDAGVLYGSTDDSFVGLGANHYLNTSGNFIYSNTDFASRFYHVNGEFYFEGAASGTAGNSFSFTERLRITSTGQIRIDQATSANNGIRMRPSGWNYDFRMGAVSSSGGSIWLGQNYEPTTNTRDNASYGTNYLRFTTQGEIMLGTGATNTNPGQRIKIKSNGYTGINANEPQTTLNVIGTISTGRNVAREVGTVISQSGNYSGSRSATNVINGNKNYEYGYDWLVGPSSGTRTNAYLVIDLGQGYTCDRFVIYNQNEYDHSNREVKNFTLEGSNDNSSWTTILDDDCGCSHGHEPNPGFSFRLPEGNIYGVDDNEGVSYRYWRFTMKTFHGSDSYGGVTELELYEVGDTTLSSNKVGSEITTSSLVAGDISTQRMNGIQMLTSSQGLNIHTGEDATDTWEITEYGIVPSGSYQDKSTIRHKRGVMAVSSSYNTGDLYVRIDNLYNLPGNAWWTFGMLILSDEVQGGLGGHHSLVTSINIYGLGTWNNISKHDIRGTMNVSISASGSNYVELFINVNDSSRGPCTVICNGGTFDPPRISFS